jgi:hypothetical protein
MKILHGKLEWSFLSIATSSAKTEPNRVFKLIDQRVQYNSV